jgi:predicted nucleic acid-binding protein
MLCHPRANPRFSAWFGSLLAAGTPIFVPEIADYELRRELIRAGLSRSIERLNALKRELRYLPLTTRTMLRAAQLWAEARNRGTPTADPKELDGDVILAAQAEQVKAIVATDNVGHLARFVRARNWEDLS